MPEPIAPAEPTTTLTAPPAAAAPTTPPAAQSATTPAAAGASPPAAAGAPAAAATAPPAAAAPAPAAIELKLPDGVKADDELIGKFKPLAQKLGLKSEQAQELADLFFASQKAGGERAAAEVASMRKGWAESLKTDKEFGGAQFEKNASFARAAVAKYASPELKAFFNSTGLGDHPEMVRLMYRIGKTIAEDSIAGTSGSGAAPDTSEEAFHRRMYPTMFKDSAS